jgi:c(7)-type cytochrome triheme protein
MFAEGVVRKRQRVDYIFLTIGVILVGRRTLLGKKQEMIHLMVLIVLVLCVLSGKAHAAEECGGAVSYDGKGAGQVVFDRAVHVSRGLACADCHEGSAFSFALFEMKRGASNVSMRNMALGRSCGYCHDGKQAFATTGSLNCSKCHQKK